MRKNATLFLIIAIMLKRVNFSLRIVNVINRFYLNANIYKKKEHARINTRFFLKINIKPIW